MSGNSSRLAIAALTLFGSSLLPAAGALGAQEVELRWRFQAGDELRYEQTQTNSSSTPMGSVSSEQITVLSKEILGVAADGAAELRVTYESLRSIQDGPMGRQEFDSQSDEAPSDPGMAVVAGLVGQAFELTMGPRGEIRRVEGVGELMEGLLEAVSETGGPAAPEVRAMLESMFSEEQMASLMQQGVHMLPAGPVEVGDTWGDELVLPLPFGTVRSDYAYVLEEILSEGGTTRARVTISGTIGELEPDPGNPMAGMVSISGGELGGEMLFDVDRGVLIRATTHTAMTMATMGQDMPIETTQTMELLDR